MQPNAGLKRATSIAEGARQRLPLMVIASDAGTRQHLMLAADVVDKPLPLGRELASSIVGLGEVNRRKQDQRVFVHKTIDISIVRCEGLVGLFE